MRTYTVVFLKAVFNAVPGYVLSPELETAVLFVQPPGSAAVASITSSNTSIMTAQMLGGSSSTTATSTTSNSHDSSSSSSSSAGRAAAAAAAGQLTRVQVTAKAPGRARLTVSFSDGTVGTVHYGVVQEHSFADEVGG